MVSWFRKKGATKDLRTLVDSLATYGVPDAILDELERYLREASDRELYQVNPHHIAAGLGIDVHTALGIMAYAVQEGLFELDWNVHCPHHGRVRSYSTLNEGRGQEYCPLCEASFDAHLDDEVHVTFTVTERVRKLSTHEPLPDDAHPPTYGLELLNVQPFRDLFSDETLPLGESLKVKRVAFLFTDLRRSTAMYAREGDPRAYGWVRQHFDVLFEAANHNRGVTVKTIGDAVMASFVTPGDAFRAAADAHQGMIALNRQLGLRGDKALMIRQGTHVGPCISVTLNDQLDYFGETVNIASRISHLSYGGDVVLSEAMMSGSEVRSEATQQGTIESFVTDLRGFDQRFELQRVIFTD